MIILSPVTGEFLSFNKWRRVKITSNYFAGPEMDLNQTLLRTCPEMFSQDMALTSITKTCPCNVYPLEPHFYIAKLGYAGVYLFFLFLLQNIDCGYSLEPPRRGGSNEYPQSMFRPKIRKISKNFY